MKQRITLLSSNIIPYLKDKGISQYEVVGSSCDIQGYFRCKSNHPRKMNVKKLKLKKEDWYSYQYIAICLSRNIEIYMSMKRGIEIDAFNNFVDIISENYPKILEPETFWVMKVKSDGLYYIGKIEKRCSEVDKMFSVSVMDSLALTTTGYKFQIVDKTEIEF